MKILMLHNRYLLPGGEDLSAEADAALLRDHGCQVELLQEDNRRIERVGKARTAARAIWSLESFHRVQAILRKGNFDVLHVQNFFPLWSPSVYYAAARCGVPVVQTLHNYRLICVNAVFFRDDHHCEDCLGRAFPWPGILHACYRKSRLDSAAVAGMIGGHRLAGTWASKVDAYVAVSEFARDKYIAGGLPPDKIVVRPNFLDPSPTPGLGGGGYSLFVGRLSPEKGIANLLEAWSTAKKPLPLKIVGDGPLRELVATTARANPGIEYVGGKSPKEVLDLMRAAEFLIFPSTWPETMGRVVMEALAVGTPVLASRMGPLISMIVPGKTGRHFLPGDVASLRDELEWCACNLDALRRIRPEARKAFEAKYTGPGNAELLLAIYHKARESKATSLSRAHATSSKA
jgi:glycosyltransferase involved in cell wall biosynthesis